MHQSILSQFSNKITATTDAIEEAEDTATLNELDDDEFCDVEENENEDGIEEDEGEEVDPAVAESDAAIIDEVAAEVANDSDLPPLTRAELNLGRFAVTKVTTTSIMQNITYAMLLQLRNLAKRIFNSPTLRADLESACVRSKTKAVLMVRDVATRWNSTAELVERALQLREALSLLVISEQHNRPRSARLKRFQLSKNEWELLEKLFPLLEVRDGVLPDPPLFDVCSQIFLIATKQMSQSKTPLVHEVIPIFDIINRALDEYVGDATLPAAVRMAAARGRTMLNKYYGLTDDSVIYRIAMCKSSYEQHSSSH